MALATEMPAVKMATAALRMSYLAHAKQSAMNSYQHNSRDYKNTTPAF